MALALAGAPSAVHADLPSLEACLGFDPRAAGAIVDPREVESCLRALAAASPRIRVETIGLSTEGRPILAAIISSPENLARLEEIRGRREAVFALVTGGVHPGEVASTLAALPLIHDLVAGRLPRGEELLREAVTCVLPALNPDGTERIARWLRGAPGGRGRAPFLEHRFAGHDLNRDWVVAGQAETLAAVRGAHERFRPWLTVDLHQMSSLGPRVFVPPYAEPRAPALPADLLLHADRLGERVFARFLATGRRGAARRWTYDAWSPARAYPFYHGGLRFLVEVAAARFAETIEIAPGSVRVFGGGNGATDDHPAPWGGGRWGLPDAADYLTFAAYEALAALLDEPWRSASRRHPAVRPDREWIRLDAAAADAGSLAALLAGLERTGAEAVRDGASWFVRDAPGTDGWCRALLLCSRYPGVSGSDSPAPYDTASHDLACMADIDALPAEAGPRTEATGRGGDGRRSPGPRFAAGRVAGGAGEERAQWLVSARSLAVFAELADLVETGTRIQRLAAGREAGGIGFAPGDFLVAGAPAAWIRKLAARGCDAAAIAGSIVEGPRGAARPFAYPHVQVLAPEGTPSRDEGWLRWTLEEHGFRFESVAAVAAPAAGNGLAPPRRFPRRDGEGARVLLVAEGVLARSGEETARALRSFVREGGRVIALGKAARDIAILAGLPVVEPGERRAFLPGTILRTRFAPGAGAGDPLLWGYARPPRVLYTEGPLWQATESARREPSASVPRVEPLLIADPDPERVCGLLSREDLETVSGKATLLRVKEGERGGEWILFGFSPHYRGWTAGTFRLLFNAVLAPRAD